MPRKEVLIFAQRLTMKMKSSILNWFVAAFFAGASNAAIYADERLQSEGLSRSREWFEPVWAPIVFQPWSILLFWLADFLSFHYFLITTSISAIASTILICKLSSLASLKTPRIHALFLILLLFATGSTTYSALASLGILHDYQSVPHNTP